jgi:hypothetical protein
MTPMGPPMMYAIGQSYFMGKIIKINEIDKN